MIASGVPSWLASVPLLVSILQMAGIIAGVIIAYKGLSTWRRQRVDGRKIDIAEAALRGFARMEDILFSIAHAAVFWNEKQEIISEFLNDFPESERERLSTYAAPLFREQRYQDEIKEFFDQRYICRAYFGRESDKYFDDIRTILIEVRIAGQMLVTRDRSEPADEDTRNLYQDLKYKIWMGSNEKHYLHVKTVKVVEDAAIFFGRELRVR